jgi:hypothetical protein
MEYTYEQKRDAFNKDALWWRFPSGEGEYAKQWSNMSHDLYDIETDDFANPEAEYHIGDKPPRVLSELERELLAALELIVDMNEEGAVFHWKIVSARAAIAKAKGEA